MTTAPKNDALGDLAHFMKDATPKDQQAFLETLLEKRPESAAEMIGLLRDLAQKK